MALRARFVKKYRLPLAAARAQHQLNRQIKRAKFHPSEWQVERARSHAACGRDQATLPKGACTREEACGNIAEGRFVLAREGVVEVDLGSLSGGPGAPPPFDVRGFAHTAVGSHRDQLALTEYDQHPLSDEALRCLRYLRDLERATTRYLRQVLMTPTHKDARITAFLTTWAFEKYWIADALLAILEQHVYPRVGSNSGARERFAPIVRSLVDNTLGEKVIAAHLAIGTVDEVVTDAAYERIAGVASNPELTRTVHRIRDVKSRHLAFFNAETRDRLRRSSLARHLARTRLRRSWWPMGAGTQPAEETAYFLARVFATAPALAREVDRRIQTLPGLERLTLVENRTSHGL